MIDEIKLTVCAGGDGELEAAYIKLSEDKVAHTAEVIPSIMLLDLNEDGIPVGFELLAPVKLSQVLDASRKLESKRKEVLEKFLENYTPRSLVECA